MRIVALVLAASTWQCGPARGLDASVDADLAHDADSAVPGDASPDAAAPDARAWPECEPPPEGGPDAGPLEDTLPWRCPEDGTWGFSDRFEYALAGVGPAALELADMDGDGDLELVVANALSWNVTVHGRGAPGALGAPLPFEAGLDGDLLGLGDLDGDGDLDVVVGGRRRCALSVLTNAGDGRLESARLYTLDAEAQSVGVADLDGDGLGDVVVAGRDPSRADPRIEVLRSDGSSLRPGPVAHLSEPLGPVVAGDLDGDGRSELMTHSRARGALVVLADRGDVGLEEVGRVTLAEEAATLALGDVDGDSDLDVVMGAAAPDPQLVVLANDGRLGFSVASRTALGAGRSLPPPHVALADVDADGALDAVAAFFGGLVSVSPGSGRGTFDGPVWYVASPGFRAPASLGDVDGDGDLDALAVSDGAVLVLRGEGDGAFRSAVGTGHGRASPLAAGDLDADGDADLVALDLEAGALVTLANDGTGGLEPVGRVPTPALVATVADLDGDGDLDVVGRSTSAVVVHEGNGDGTLAEGAVYGDLPGSVLIVRTGDLDGDSRADVVVSAGDGLTLLRNRGDGRLDAPEALDDGDCLNEFFLVDLDHDGWVDAVTTSWTAEPPRPAVGYLRNSGAGILQPFRDFYTVESEVGEGGIGSIWVADVDGDLAPDVVANVRCASHCSISEVVVLRARLGFSFSEEARTVTSPLVSWEGSADFDRDGMEDLVMDDRVFFGRRDGSLEWRRVLPPGASSVVVADMNGDGLPDLARGTRYGGTTVFFGCP